MDTQIHHLLTEASKLSPVQRATLADALLESISPDSQEPQASAIDPAIGQAWGDEIRRRIAEAEAGRVTMIPHKDALPRKRNDG